LKRLRAIIYRSKKAKENGEVVEEKDGSGGGKRISNYG